MRLAPEAKAYWGLAVLLWALCLAAAAIFHNYVTLWVAGLSFIPALLTVWFFRDPLRQIPPIPKVVVSPADGKVIEISTVTDPEPWKGDHRKISIFMSPLNVHVNRIPVGGVIELLRYNRGRFSAAFHPEASSQNERQFVSIRTSLGVVGVVQVAGWLARRIVCHLQEGQQVETGQRFGMIRFGSRLDVYLPADCMVGVTKKQKVRAGETVIGVLHEKK